MNQFWLKWVNLLLVVGLLLGYNAVVEQRTQAEDIDRLQADLEIAKMREENALEKAATQIATSSEISNSPESGEEEPENSLYQDGTYQGSGQGYGGSVTVQVAVESDTITDIVILSAPKEDRAYLEMASSIVNDILKQQTTEVDTVSGATFSSTGIRNAVSNALKKAEKRE